jgi:hypothetical protein
MKRLEWNGNNTRAEFQLTANASTRHLFAEVYESTMIDENFGRWCVFFADDLGIPTRWFDSKDEAYLYVEATFTLEVM